MGYHVIDPYEIEPTPNRPSLMRDISNAAKLSNIGLRFYEVQPGEELPLLGMHYHEQQEEVFFVIDGSLIAETPERSYEIDNFELFIAKPGSPHRIFNDTSANQVATVLAMGAPSVEDYHPVDAE